jgi:hypothetical protein
MHFHLEKLALVAAFAIGGMGAAYAQTAAEQLQPLVETNGAPAHDWRTGSAGEVG